MLAVLLLLVSEALSLKVLMYPAYYAWAFATTPLITILNKSLDEISSIEWTEVSDILHILRTSFDLAAWPKPRSEFAMLVLREWSLPAALCVFACVPYGVSR